ncbi:MAG: hypothetical protein ACSLFK_10020 [Gemmatimonadaceae bacterium]
MKELPLTVLLAAAVSIVPAAAARAQTAEGRVDAIFAEPNAVHAGAGVTWRLGTYLRSGVVAGIGATEAGVSARLDFVNRFHLDPFRESRYGPYAGGGVSTRFDDGRTGRVFLLLIVGVDGPVARGVTTSFEAGLGGGARIGLVIRRATPERR